MTSSPLTSRDHRQVAVIGWILTAGCTAAAVAWTDPLFALCAAVGVPVSMFVTWEWRQAVKAEASTVRRTHDLTYNERNPR